MSHKIQRIIRRTKNDVTHRLRVMEEDMEADKINIAESTDKRLTDGFKYMNTELVETKKEVHKL